MGTMAKQLLLSGDPAMCTHATCAGETQHLRFAGKEPIGLLQTDQTVRTIISDDTKMKL